MIIRSALRSFWRYVKRSSEQRALWSVTGFRRLFRAFLTLSWSLFSVLPKSTSPSRVGPLCKATFSSYTHDRVERPRQTTHAYTLRECGSEVSKLVWVPVFCFSSDEGAASGTGVQHESKSQAQEGPPKLTVAAVCLFSDRSNVLFLGTLLLSWSLVSLTRIMIITEWNWLNWMILKLCPNIDFRLQWLHCGLVETSFPQFICVVL